MKYVGHEKRYDEDVAYTLAPVRAWRVEVTDAGRDDHPPGHIVMAEWIRRAIDEDTGVDGERVHVEVFEGVVQLSGSVTTRDCADRLLACVQLLEGVDSVRDCLQRPSRRG